MKIGILTHPLDYNYGCLLQAFALQKTLTGMGHDVVTINRYTDPHKAFTYLLKSWCSRFIKKLIKNADVSLAWNPTETLAIKEKLSSNTQKFVDRNIVNTGVVLPKDLSRIDDEYKFDAYVVGSDQVWLPHFCPNSFLDFVKRDNVIRLFYAASSGKKSFADNQVLAEKCKELCAKFAGVSVREQSLIQLVKEALGRDAVQVLDPTLLLDKQDYLKACIEKEDASPIIFTYILDKNEEKRKLVDKVRSVVQLPVVSGTVEKDYVRGKHMNIDDCIYPSVEHWINSLNRAKFVVTDSFHGTCMSIIFRKPFVVVGNKARGIERFNSVLSMFGLKNRLIETVDEFDEGMLDNLDSDRITENLSLKREESMGFLKQHLS